MPSIVNKPKRKRLNSNKSYEGTRTLMFTVLDGDDVVGTHDSFADAFKASRKEEGLSTGHIWVRVGNR